MPLSLGVTIGSKIRVGADTLEVLDVQDAMDTKVRVGKREFTITDLERQEVLPDVFISLGWSENTKDARFPNFSRLAIEAPRALRIERVNDRVKS